MTSECGKNNKEVQPDLSLLFLSDFEIICDLLVSRPITGNLFVLDIMNKLNLFMEMPSVGVSSSRS